MKSFLLSGLAVVALACGPAVAGEVKTGGIPVSGASAMMMHPGALAMAGGQMWGPGPLVGSDTAVATNVAAGIGNVAQQNFGALQGGGRGGLVDTDTAVTTNVAAGIANFAGQFGVSRRR